MFVNPSTRRILVVAGTRPECLKLASLIAALRADRRVELVVLNSGQHHAMVERTFAHLGLACDRAPGQIDAHSLSHGLAILRARIGAMALDMRADLLITQGDTSTAYAGALASRDARVPLAHVEAGLRTAHPYRPFPEELFRRRIARIARLHYAPTPGAAANLLAEGIDAQHVHRVGNTIVDLLRERIGEWRGPDTHAPGDQLEQVTLTLHRRENYGRGLDNVCAAVVELLARRAPLHVVCPVHPNPTVGSRIRRNLGGHPRIALVEPLDYRPFIALLARSRLAITDSGGIQEEAPYLGTPVLVVRENTERPEAVALGAATLVAPVAATIVEQALRVLARPRPLPVAFDAHAPFGDGLSGQRIATHVADFVLNRPSIGARAFALGGQPAVAS